MMQFIYIEELVCLILKIIFNLIFTYQRPILGGVLVM